MELQSQSMDIKESVDHTLKNTGWTDALHQLTSVQLVFLNHMATF